LVPSAFWWVKKRFAFTIGDTHNVPANNGPYLALGLELCPRASDRL
jgi:hypothetical protein